MAICMEAWRVNKRDAINQIRQFGSRLDRLRNGAGAGGGLTGPRVDQPADASLVQAAISAGTVNPRPRRPTRLKPITSA